MTTAHRPTYNQALGNDAQSTGRLVPITMKLCSRDVPGQTTLKNRTEFEDRDVTEIKAQLLEKEQAHFRTIRETRDPSFVPAITAFPEDKDDDIDEDEISDDSDDDEEAELKRELDKIKREREDEERKRAEAIEKEAEAEEKKRILSSNPLGGMTDDISSSCLKRRWDEDVVFKNQSRGVPATRKRFINDAVRSEFHRKFMAKYIL